MSVAAAPAPVTLGAQALRRHADLAVDADRMLRIQGYVEPARVRRPIRAAAERNARLAERLMVPEVRYRRVAVGACDGGRLALAGGAVLESRAFSRYLAAAREIAAFVLTAGPALDEEAARLNAAGELLDVLFLENAGWLGVEAITKALVGHLRAEAAADGLRLTRRLGPGYAYRVDGAEAAWPLEEQPRLLALLGDGPLPVRLLESCAMLPRMSRSGLVGLVPREG